MFFVVILAMVKPDALSAAPENPEVKKLFYQYEKSLTQLKQAALNQNVDQAKELGQNLAGVSQKIFAQAKAKASACGDYLAQLDLAKLIDLGSEELESDYHKGKKLGKEPNHFCYELKDLMIHPLQAYALTREAAGQSKEKAATLIDDAVAELNEVRGHLAGIKRTLED